MKTRKMFPKALAILLSLCMCMSIFQVVAMAVDISYDPTIDGFNTIVSKNDYQLCPGATESQIVVNNDSGANRNVIHVMEVDLKNEGVSVMPTYMGLEKGKDLSLIENQSSAGLTKQAAHIESLGYNVVGGINTHLSYASNAPLSVLVWDGVVYDDGSDSSAQNYLAVMEDGTAELRSMKGGLRGDEYQAVSASFGFVVKDGVAVNKTVDHSYANRAPRTMIGIKADGTLVLVMVDGRQTPYSEGLTSYEMSQTMLSLGCVNAVNCDGGGSSTFVTKREGTDNIVMRSSPSDGSERPTLDGLLVISHAKATGEFDHANISSSYDYVAPGTTSKYSALGVDSSGFSAEIPADVEWAISDASFGTIAEGTFVSNGKVGDVDIQMIYGGKVVGSKTVHVVNPDTVAFANASTVIPFGKSVSLDLNVKYGEHNVLCQADTFDITLSDQTAGTIDGLTFNASSDETKKGTNIVVTYKYADLGSTTMNVTFGKGSEVIFNFEDGDISDWKDTKSVIPWIEDYNANNGDGRDVNMPSQYSNMVYDGMDSGVFLASKDNGGEVKHGNYSLGWNVDWRYYQDSDAYIYNYLYYVGETVIFRDIANNKNATSIGFWLHLPEEFAGSQQTVRLIYSAITNAGASQGAHTAVKIGTKNCSGLAASAIPEDGWVYVSVSLTGFKYASTYSSDITASNRAGNTWFYPAMFNCYGTAAGGTYEARKLTFYIDDITLDYSSAVDDREAPIISGASYVTDDTAVAMDNQTVSANKLSFTASIADDTTKTNATGIDVSTAKIYVDGVEISGVNVTGSTMYVDNVVLANGKHSVTFEISDKLGNTTKLTKEITISAASVAPVITIAGHNDLGNVPEADSVYYVDLKTSDISKVKSVTTELYLNTANSWELDNMVAAKGYKATYSVNECEPNRVTVTVTKTGECPLSGEQILVSIPTRVYTWDSDIQLYYGDKVDRWTATGCPTPIAPIKCEIVSGKVAYTDAGLNSIFGSFTGAINVETNVESNAITGATKWHAHTAAAVADKAATCTTDGYTGRTYCAECGSVVDWGTTLPATGHSFTVTSDGLYTCATCGDTFYYVGGVAQNGWKEIDGNWYYFNADGIAANGEATIDGYTYTFENCVLTKGAWFNDGVGLTYMWAGEEISGGWQNIEGKTYHFTGIYADTGVHKVGLGYAIGYKWYIFDSNGVWQNEQNGVFTWNGNTYYAQNGIAVYAGVVADAQGNLYYINSKCTAVKNCSYTIGSAKANGLVDPGVYEFDENGKMIIAKNGLTLDDDGELRFYKNDVAQYAGIVKDADGNFYYINSSKKAVKNCSYAIGTAKANGLVEAGTYKFGSDGKMIIEKSGLVVDADGEIRYYVNGAAQYAGVVKDADGNIYYINSSKKAVKNCSYAIGTAKANGIVEVGTYKFGADGKLVVEKSGLIVDADGETRYYVNGAAQYAGVVADAQGNLYYINSSKKAVKNCTYSIGTAKANGLVEAGRYVFDADGKMVK